MEVNRLISNYNFTAGSESRVRYLVIHYCGAESTAKGNAEYFAGGKRNASAHYFVGHGGDVWQSVEDKNVAWHCGAKEYRHKDCRNSNSIGIELCTRTTGSVSQADENWYFEDATVDAAVALTRELMAKYKITPDRVLRHYDVTGKVCPTPYVFNKGKHTWAQFKAAIAADGKEIPTPSAKQERPAGESFLVHVDTLYLNIRKGPGTDYAKTGKYTGKGTFTVVEVKPGKGASSGWGRLKSGAGWISLDYVRMV